MSRIALLICVVLILPVMVLGQGPGKIAGKVTDESTGQPLVGANVVIEGTLLGNVTDADGAYFILNVRPGSYTLKATYVGYRPATITNVIVTSELTTEVNIKMQSEAVELPTLEIVAERPLVNKTATNAIYTMRVEDIKHLPVRGYLDVIGLQPGVVKLGNDLHVRGGRTDEVGYFIDGMIVNNPFNSKNAGTVVSESIEEVTYQAGGFNAEYGSANAGLVSTTTKAGGTKFSFSIGGITDEFLPKERIPAISVPPPARLYTPPSVNDSDYAQYQQELNAYNRSAHERIKAARGSNKLQSYGTNIFHASVGGPLPIADEAIRFHIGAQQTVALDATPTVSNPILPDNKLNETAINSNIMADFKPVSLRLGGFSSFSNDRIFSRYHSVFNASRMAKREASTHAYYGRVTHTIGNSTYYTAQVSWFRTEVESGDPVWFDDIDSYGDPAKNPVLISATGQPNPGRNPANIYHDLFAGPGFVNFAHPTLTGGSASYAYNQSSYIAGKIDLSHQLDKTHLFKIGGEYRYNTIRFWETQADRFWRVKSQSPTFTREELLRNSYTSNLGVKVDGIAKGKKEFLDDGSRNSAPHPIIAAGYIQDKIELEDLVLNLGLRYDYFNANVDVFKDPHNIGLDNKGSYYEISDTNYVAGKAAHTFSPRLGFSFPVSDRTVFHAQYGHFTQPVELHRLYTSTTVLAQQLTAGNYVNVGNPGLKPERTISYEIGFTQQLGDNASLGITAYYKDVKDLIQLQNTIARPVQYARYVNGDFGTIRGASLSFQLRRTNRVAASVNYTLQYATGTGSSAQSNFNIAWLGGNFPDYVTPLDFDQRHTGSINFDFRTLKEDGPILGEVGVNLLYTFGSGRAYTPALPKTILFGQRWEQPIAAHNQTYSPWNHQMDLKIDKSFTVGPLNGNVYLWVVNLFNTLNVTEVYNFTGLPDDDGYFKTPEGQAWAAQHGQEGVDGYRYRLMNDIVTQQSHYGIARQVRLGLRFDYN